MRRVAYKVAHKEALSQWHIVLKHLLRDFDVSNTISNLNLHRYIFPKGRIFTHLSSVRLRTPRCICIQIEESPLLVKLKEGNLPSETVVDHSRSLEKSQLGFCHLQYHRRLLPFSFLK